MTTDQPQPLRSTGTTDGAQPPLKKILRNPVKRFGDTPLESQLHDPIMGVFDRTLDPSFSYVSHDPSEPVKLLLALDVDQDVGQVFETLNAWEADGDLSSYTLFGPGMQRLSLVRQHPRALWTKKRTVYLPPPAVVDNAGEVTVDKKGAKKAAVGLAVFNVKKSAFGSNPTYYGYLGAHQGTHLDPAAHPLYKKPFLVMSTTNNRTDIARQFKFTATLTSLRMPTGDAVVDSVMAVERKSHLVVLASGKMRDLFVFLRPGRDKWRWACEHAPGMLIARTRPCTPGTVNSMFVGPETVQIEVAAGVDARLVVAVVLAAIAHFQAF